MNSFFILLLILIFIELSFGQNQTDYCDKSKECEKCMWCHDVNQDYCSCSFNNGYCLYENDVWFSEQFLDHFDGCIKNNGDFTDICGDSDIELNNGEKQIHIPVGSSPNFLCYYNFKYIGSDNPNMIITLQRSNIEHPIFYLYLKNDINNDMIKYRYQSINTNNYELINIKAKKISLYIDILELEYTDGLFLKFSIKKDPVPVEPEASKTFIYIIIGVGVAIIIIAGIIIFLIVKSKPPKIITDDITVGEIQDKKAILDDLFKNKLKNKIYDKNNDMKCELCKEKFIYNSSRIIKLKCKDIFHSVCLKNFAYKDIDDPEYPKCPKCKAKIEDADENELPK